jgi:hypothetical protein
MSQPQAANAARLCRIERILGRAQECPGEGCAFWEPGGPVVEGRCVFERIDLSNDPLAAAWLLHVRRMLSE